MKAPMTLRELLVYAVIVGVLVLANLLIVEARQAGSALPPGGRSGIENTSAGAVFQDNNRGLIVYQCLHCGKYFMHPYPTVKLCAVDHAGTCCHYGDVEITKENYENIMSSFDNTLAKRQSVSEFNN